MARMIDADKLLDDITAAEEHGGMGAVIAGTLRRYVMRQPTLTQPNEWIRTEDNMPSEHDSMFKQFKGTSVWSAGMFERISDNVNVAVKFDDGNVKVYTAHTADGKWRNLPIMGNPTVTHWMPLPAPPDRRPTEGEA